MAGSDGGPLLVGYRGDEPVGCMTAAEWAEELGVRRESVMWRATPSGRERAGRRGLALYRVEDEGEEE